MSALQPTAPLAPHHLSSDPLHILLLHDHWANRRVLELCRELTPDQFHTRFDIGPGSLHDTLAHVIAALRRWGDRLTERPLRPAIDIPPRKLPVASDYRHRTPDELLELLDPAAAELAALANAYTLPNANPNLSSQIEISLDGNRYRITRGAGLVHIATHGSHHRAQCLNMLRRLGINPLPELTIVDWQAEVESKQIEPSARRNLLPST